VSVPDVVTLFVTPEENEGSKESDNPQTLKITVILLLGV